MSFMQSLLCSVYSKWFVFIHKVVQYFQNLEFLDLTTCVRQLFSILAISPLLVTSFSFSSNIMECDNFVLSKNNCLILLILLVALQSIDVLHCNLAQKQLEWIYQKNLFLFCFPP